MRNHFLRQIGRTIGARSKLASSAHRSFVHATNPLLEKKTVPVPTMGDSITEGTIVEWTAAVGQMVEEGDVVALVETDKVTVDIKADMTGVLTQQFGAVDDTVEVGSDLYQLDTEAEATTAAAAPKAEGGSPQESATTEVSETPASPAPKPATTSNTATQATRVPSIKFLGKEGWMRALAGVPELPPVPSNFGRPAFTEDEMEALMTGGANLVPEVKDFSSGAVFA